MIYRVANMEFDKKIPYEKVEKIPSIGIYHPGHRELFTEIERYLTWYKGRKGYSSGKPWTGMIFYSSKPSAKHKKDVAKEGLKSKMVKGYNIIR
jgi:cobaltochelatase CobN